MARLPLIDAARGVAILAMVVYHFSWDLRYFGYISANVTDDLGWRIFARLIAGSFLFVVGVSLVLATRSGFNRTRYLRRLGVIVAAAAAITAVTFFAFRDSFIFFGILHHIAVASVLGLAFVNAPLLLVVAAAVACFFAAPLLAGPAFDSPALIWLGLASYFPRTNDFVPLFPWFGVVLAGIGAARLALKWPDAVSRVLGRSAPAPLVLAGRNSLVIYLLHQPLLFGLVFLAAELAPPSFKAFVPSYVKSCTTRCTAPGSAADMCARSCACHADRLQAEGLWSDLMRNGLSEAQEERYFALLDQCRSEAGF